jgi:hypothetical protein
LNLREKALKNPAFPDQEVGSCWYLRELKNNEKHY